MNVISYILAAISVFIVLYIGLHKKHNLLREEGKNGAPYSLARSQLWLWTIIIPAASVLMWGNSSSHIFALNDTALILLGITSAVTVTSNGIVAAKKTSTTVAYAFKHTQTSKGWFYDLILDETGQLSITRLQNVIFTLIYIAIFVSDFIASGMKTLPTFASTAFGLMGISGAAYVVGKGIVNTHPVETTTTAQPKVNTPVDIALTPKNPPSAETNS